MRPFASLPRITLSLSCALLFGVLGCGKSGASEGAKNDDESDPDAKIRTDVIVHLFEWPWPDIAKECENYLGPAGFGAVQISPPNEHAIIGVYPWWQRYQPVSYELESRSGTTEQFADMVARCKTAGVDIYVDAVINHMTAQTSGTGSAGTSFEKYSYPGLWEKSDFHEPTCTIEGSDYASNAGNVQSCELLGLSDLDTGKDGVREKLANYLAGLVKLGVKGFRVDAAKHMSPADLKAILDRTAELAGGKKPPNYYLEVIDRGGEAISSADYLTVFAEDPNVAVNEFRYDRVNEFFKREAGQNVAGLKNFGDASWGLMPSERAVVFTNNHDTQRGSALYYEDGGAYALGNVFLLTYPYGRPLVMSSYAFARSAPGGIDKGPPSDPPGKTKGPYAAGNSEPACSPSFEPHTYGEWVCEHRSTHTKRLIAFRASVGSAPLENVTVPAPMMLSYSRGSSGFVLLNGSEAPFTGKIATGLAEGTYCNVLADLTSEFGCDTTISVAANGEADVSLASNSALVLHSGAIR